MISSTDKKVVIWPLIDECSMQTFNCHDGIVWSVCFNADGTRIVSTGDDGSVQVYQSQSFVCLKKILLLFRKYGESVLFPKE